MRRDVIEPNGPIKKVTIEFINGKVTEHTFPTPTRVDQANKEGRQNTIWPRMTLFTPMPDEEGNTTGVNTICQGCNIEDLEMIASSALHMLFQHSNPIHFTSISQIVLDGALSMYCQGDPIKEMMLKASMISGIVQKLRNLGGDPSAN